MPTEVIEVDVLQRYLQGVLARADHHANNVNEIVLAIAGAIVWRKDPDAIEVMAREGDLKNVLWVRIGGQRYAFTYNHDIGAIELRRGNNRGQVLHELTNATPLATLRDIFAGL